MATIEIDESELGNLKKIQATIAKISTNPEGKRLLQKAHKLIDPNAVTPDLDADAEKEKLTGEMGTQVAELKAQIAAGVPAAALDFTALDALVASTQAEAVADAPVVVAPVDPAV